MNLKGVFDNFEVLESLNLLVPSPRTQLIDNILELIKIKPNKKRTGSNN
jgi:hypothetical protein